MGAGFVRFGGISGLLTFAACILVFVLTVANPELVQTKIVYAIILLVLSALGIVMYLATKTLWSRFGRTGANIPIIFIVLMTVAFLILSLLGGGALGSMGRNSGAIFFIVFLLLLGLNFVAWLWFAIYCIAAGGSVGGVWRAAGILYLIGTLLGIIAAIVGLGALVKLVEAAELDSPGSFERALEGGITAFGAVAFLIFGIAGVVLLAGYVCHIVGLFSGAAKLERAQ